MYKTRISCWGFLRSYSAYWSIIPGYFLIPKTRSEVAYVSEEPTCLDRVILRSWHEHPGLRCKAHTGSVTPQSPPRMWWMSVQGCTDSRAAIAGLYKPGSNKEVLPVLVLATGLVLQIVNTLRACLTPNPDSLKLRKYLNKSSTLTSHFAETRVLMIVDSL